jgi:hypothetical protein
MNLPPTPTTPAMPTTPTPPSLRTTPVRTLLAARYRGGFDLDNCLALTTSHKLRWLHERGLLAEACGEEQLWDYWLSTQFPDVTYPRIREVWAEPEFLQSIPPSLPMVQALQTWTRQGHGIHIVTARSEKWQVGMEARTRAWLGQARVPYDRLVYTAAKAEYADTHALDFFVEDVLETANALAEGGCPCLLVALPYNSRERAGRAHSWVRRESRPVVASLLELLATNTLALSEVFPGMAAQVALPL